jgi:hypothetical protein
METQISFCFWRGETATEIGRRLDDAVSREVNAGERPELPVSSNSNVTAK